MACIFKRTEFFDLTPIGLLCLLLLVGHKCRVIVAGTSEDAMRLDLARELGADVTANMTEQDLASVVERETGGKGVDVAVERAGVPESVIADMRCLEKMGKYVLILRKQIQLFGSVGHSSQTWERVQRIFEQRKLELTRLITHKMPLSRWREAF